MTTKAYKQRFPQNDPINLRDIEMFFHLGGDSYLSPEILQQAYDLSEFCSDRDWGQSEAGLLEISEYLQEELGLTLKEIAGFYPVNPYTCAYHKGYTTEELLEYKNSLN